MKSKLVLSGALVLFLTLMVGVSLNVTQEVVNEDVNKELNVAEKVEADATKSLGVVRNEVENVASGLQYSTEEVTEILEPLQLPIEEVDMIKYASTKLNVRELPNTECEVLGKLNRRDEVHIVGICSNGWYKIEYGDSYGYVCNDYVVDEQPSKAYLICSTAYYNPNGNKTADGSDTIANFTLAGMREWFGKGCYLYKCNPDGSMGECIGYYEFHDTGWGIDGDIPRGETIDIYMETYDKCVQWGRRNVYIEFVD